MLCALAFYKPREILMWNVYHMNVWLTKTVQPPKSVREKSVWIHVNVLSMQPVELKTTVAFVHVSPTSLEILTALNAHQVRTVVN